MYPGTDATEYVSVGGNFSQVIMKDLRLVSGYDVLYGKVKEFIARHLFDREIDIDDLNTLRNFPNSKPSRPSWKPSSARSMN